jgi:hypothetical protein
MTNLAANMIKMKHRCTHASGFPRQHFIHKVPGKAHLILLFYLMGFSSMAQWTRYPAFDSWMEITSEKTAFKHYYNTWSHFSQGHVLKTSDGGITSTEVLTSGFDFGCCIIAWLKFWSENSGAAMVTNTPLSGTVYLTSNGGEDWYDTQINEERDFYTPYSFLNNESIYRIECGPYFRIEYWNGSGQPTVQYEESQINTCISSLFFINDSTGFVSWQDTAHKITLYRTADSARTLIPLPDSLLPSNRFHYPKSGPVFMVNGNSKLFSSPDLGRTWKLLYHLNGDSITGQWFLDSLNGYLITKANFILHTKDGGYSWEKDSIQTGNMLTRIFFTQDGTGFIRDNLGTVYKKKPAVGLFNLSKSTSPLNLVPNPAIDQVMLVTDEFEGEITDISLLSLDGRILFHSDNFLPQISLHNFTRGVFMIRYNFRGNLYYSKLIKGG